MNTKAQLYPPIVSFEPFSMARVPAIRQARTSRVLAYYLSKETKPRAKSAASKTPKAAVLPPHLLNLPPEIRDKVVAALREKKLL